MEIINDIEQLSELDKVVQCMEAGNPVIIPTDTNYNLACFPESSEAIDKIFYYKKRPKNKPLSLFFLKPEDWRKYGFCENDEVMQLLIEKFWPGPLNIIVNKKDSSYDYMLNGMDSIALGCISNPTWRTFMQALRRPVAITSANISGTVDDMLVTEEIAIEQMGTSVEYFIKSQKPITASKSSTIVIVTKKGVKILREGDIDRETLNRALIERGYCVEQ